MTTLTLRRMKDDFIVTGPDMQPAKFKRLREAQRMVHGRLPGLAHKEIGADASERKSRAPRKESLG
jgi:hypothetical protein